MKTREDFERDFVEELELGTLVIVDKVSEETIFILQDGTIINAEFDDYGSRCTDHHQVLQVEGYDMDDLVTIEPESQTVILPINLTCQQINSLDGLEETYFKLVITSSSYDDNAIYLVNHLLDCGASLNTALTVIMDETWSVIDEDELSEYDECKKENLIYLDNDVIVEVQ